SVGGPMLGTILKQMRSSSGVASIGLAGGVNFPGNVAPFVLRGVSMYGVNSPPLPYETRMRAWVRLAELFRPSLYEPILEEKALADLSAAADDILAGRVRGRIIVDPSA